MDIFCMKTLNSWKWCRGTSGVEHFASFRDVPSQAVAVPDAAATSEAQCRSSCRRDPTCANYKFHSNTCNRREIGWCSGWWWMIDGRWFWWWRWFPGGWSPCCSPRLPWMRWFLVLIHLSPVSTLPGVRYDAQSAGGPLWRLLSWSCKTNILEKTFQRVSVSISWNSAIVRLGYLNQFKKSKKYP